MSAESKQRQTRQMVRRERLALDHQSHRPSTQRPPISLRRPSASHSLDHRSPSLVRHYEQPETRSPPTASRLQACVSANRCWVLLARQCGNHRPVRALAEPCPHNDDPRPAGQCLLHVPDATEGSCTRRLQADTRP